MMNKLPVSISPLQHRGAQRIKVGCPFDEGIISKIKQIEGRLWSKTHSCWHVPYSPAAYRQLKDLFNINVPSEFVKPEKNEPELPHIQKDTVLAAPGESKKGDIQPQFIDYKNNGKTGRVVSGEKILVKKLNQHWLAVYVPYDKKIWMGAVKGIEGRKWDTENTCWQLPYVKASFYQLKKTTGLENVVFDFEIEKDIPSAFDGPARHRAATKPKTRRFDQLDEKQKAAVQLTEQALLLKRYSHSTLKSYRSHLEGLFLYHIKKAPGQLGPKEVQQYLLHLIKFKGISESTQNQVINAYKAYAEKVLGRPKEWIDIPRPKKPVDLPNVLSENEVAKLINTPDNIKHNLILLLIYSAGLRLGEVVNIRVNDVSLDRRAIFIRRAKGKKDRYVTLAETVIPFLEEYKKEYCPAYWLFEGQYGGQYSKSSVQKIFRVALEKSKVNAYATVHTLRHSYATHCVENGYNLALIQEALGHQSLKTTQKYLHVSTKAMRQLISPLDILKDKKQR